MKSFTWHSRNSRRADKRDNRFKLYYLSAKKDYCDSLKTLVLEKTTELEVLSEDCGVFVARVEYRGKMASFIAVLLIFDISTKFAG